MTLEGLLEAYDADHTHPLNRALHLVGITLIGGSVVLVFVIPPLGIVSFALGWACQFVGHAIEGKPPSFTRDPRYMFVGAVWYRERIKELLKR